MSDTIFVLNGPNLNLLGTREPAVYGHDTLVDVERLALETAAAAGWEVRCVQSNHEGVLIDAIHEARADCAGIVINPGGLTHTSVALRDAWFDAPDLAAQQALARQLQTEAMRTVPYIPLGQYFQATAYRTSLSDVLSGFAIFWNLRKA